MMPASTGGQRKTIALDVDPAALVRLGSVVGNVTGVLNPFRDDDPLSDEMLANLKRDGVLDKQGHTRKEHDRVWSVLRSANRVTRVQLAGSARMFEYFVYFGESREEPVSLKLMEGLLRIEDPAATDDAIAYLGNMIGSSSFVGTEFAIELGPAEALVFAALVDGQRRRRMKQLGDGTSAARSFNAASIAESLRKKPDDLISLAAIVRSMTAAAELPSEESTDAAIASLLARGHVSRHGKGVQVAQPGAGVAARLLNVDSVLTLLAVHADPSGDQERVGFTCAIGGLHDLLSIEYVRNSVHFETITSRAVLATIDFFLRHHEAVPVRRSADAAVPVRH